MKRLLDLVVIPLQGLHVQLQLLVLVKTCCKVGSEKTVH